MADSSATPIDRILDLVEHAPAGMHWLGQAAIVLDSAWPEPLAAVYRGFDGAALFHETVLLKPAAQVVRVQREGDWVYDIGQVDGDALGVDKRGRPWRFEKDTGEWLLEGSRIDRWLWGLIEAERLLYQDDGEFADDTFDDSGELTPAMSERIQRRILKRDRDAAAPRWRLARSLVQQERFALARDELERLVAVHPDFAWAWFDLGRISEHLGALSNAIDEFEAAAEARPGYEYAGFFWAHGARLAHATGDEERRGRLAERALGCDPGLVAAQRDGAQASLDEDALDAARELAETACALAPRDLVVRDLLARIRARAAR